MMIQRTTKTGFTYFFKYRANQLCKSGRVYVAVCKAIVLIFPKSKSKIEVLVLACGIGGFCD